MLKAVVSFFVLPVVTVSFGVSVSASQEELVALDAESNARVARFGGELKKELVAALTSGGPVAGIAVCQSRAPQIAEANSREGWTVARTSLKYRNPENRPDEWEIKWLENFKRRQEQGEDVKTLMVSEIKDGEYRYIRAIPTAEVCTTCHGSELAPAVENALKDYYPDDLARGYKVGDIRGAFTVIKQFSNESLQ